LLRLPGAAFLTGTLSAPEIVVPAQVKSVGNVLKALGRAITQQWFPGVGDMQVMGLDSNTHPILISSLVDGLAELGRLTNLGTLRYSPERRPVTAANSAYRVAALTDEAARVAALGAAHAAAAFARRAANQAAAVERRRLVAAVERLRASGKWHMVAGADGRVDLEAVLGRSK
jgi:hypothetical protein